MKTIPLHSALTLLLLCLLSVALAHGHDEGEAMDVSGGEMGHNTTPNPSNATDSGPPSYFRHTEYSGLMLAHIVLMSVGWIFILPIGVMLSIAQSTLTFPIQFAFLVINGFGVLLATIYNANTSDLYPNNAHHKLGWMLVWVICAQIFMGLISKYTRRIGGRGDVNEREAFIPISTENMMEHRRFQDIVDSEFQRFSNDSGHGTLQQSDSSRNQSISSLGEDRIRRIASPHRESDHDEKPKVVNKLKKILTRGLTILMSSRARIPIITIYETMNRLILLLGFVALTTGVVTYGGIFRGPHIFSGLAHFIKGGVFFWYGVLTLGRWAGCFSDLGWAWNIKPSKNLVGRRKALSPSAEFVESFLIFFYGSTNVFLEHLAAWGSAWSPQDLEHISITIMFFGGGLCGMLIESRKVRDLLNTAITQSAPGRASSAHETENIEKQWQAPKSYGISMNPLPALIILLLGMMMSSHHQASMVSTMVHKQWGTLLVGASFARAVTYILFYVSPPTSILPSRPPSELITAFCLMAGGLIFMASSADTIEAMEYNDLGAMFVFTVTMGVITFLMAWIIVVIAIKGWAIGKEGKSQFLFRSRLPTAA